MKLTVILPVTGEADVGEGEEFAVHIDVHAVDQSQDAEGAAGQDHPATAQESGQQGGNAGEDQGPAGGEQPQQQVLLLPDDPQVEEEILEAEIQGQQRQEIQRQMKPVGSLREDLPGQPQGQVLPLFSFGIHKTVPFFRGYS